MKFLKLKAVFIVLLIASITSVWSCNKDDEDNDTSSAKDNSIAETTFSDIHSMVDQANNYNSAKGVDSSWSSYFSGCVTVTRDTISNPHQIVIDFGSANCLCNDGKYRRGVVTASYTGRYRDSATIINISLSNYYVNDNQILGTKTITNKGRNSDGNWNFDIAVSGQIIKANNGGTVTWNSTRNREWLEGSNTITVWDDVFLVTGEANGMAANGTSYEINITNPLRKEIGCTNFVSGTFTLKIPQKAIRTVDYGNGNCDNTATLTILNSTYTITLN